MDSTDILIKIRKIVRSINLESKKIQKEYGVSIPQVLCLNFLKNQSNYQSSQNEIRKFLNLNSSTVSGIINRLEKKGLLARLPRSGDKRIVNIALTDEGFKLIDSIPFSLHEQLSAKLHDLPEDKIQQIIQGLDTIINMMNIDKVDASPMLAINIDLEE